MLFNFRTRRKKLIFSEAAEDGQIFTKTEVKFCIKCHVEKHSVLLCLFSWLSI